MNAYPEPVLTRRGIVLAPSDVATWNWAQAASTSGLTTIALHAPPGEVVAFVRTARGAAFLAQCAALGLEVEYELHAARELLPREWFSREPAMFRMDERGERVADWNLCVHSQPALLLAGKNAVALAEVLRPTTGRYFFWIDDGKPMCKCSRCRELSDSDQALILENHLLDALRAYDRRSTLAHLAYLGTLQPPRTIRPRPGVFLEFAPIMRRHEAPMSQREERAASDAPAHGEQLDALDANLAVFGAKDAQVLEYWLDASRFARWKRERLAALPWSDEVLREDLATYAGRGIRSVTSFGVWLDGAYVRRFGRPPVEAYGAALCDPLVTGRPS